MTTAAALTIERIKTIPPIPQQGQRYLSINLAVVSLTEAMKVATELGFAPQLVLVPYRNGVAEIHALLWQGAIEETPTDLEAKVDELADRIDNQAIRHCWGSWKIK